MTATAASDRQPKFKEGDRVRLWHRPDAGTVDEVWFDGPNEIVAVVWFTSGCMSECRAYQLRHA